MKTAYCFDLDGTITKDEVLPLLAKEIGLYEEINALTEATIKGVIPFYNSFLLRCKLLRDVPISKVHNILESVRISERISTFIKENKDNCFIITGNLDAWVEPLLQSFGCKYFCSLAEVEGDMLIKPSVVLDKGEVIKKLRNDFTKIVAIGDGMGDVSMFEQADIGIAYGGVHSPIQMLVQWSNFITFHDKSLCNLLNTL